MAPKPRFDRTNAFILLGLCATIAHLVVQCAHYNVQLQHSLQEIENFQHRLETIERSLPQQTDENKSNLESSRLQETRLTDLDTKVNSFLNWGQDPYLSTRLPIKCANSTDLRSFGCAEGDKDENCPGLYDSQVCLDSFPYDNCIVYDFGIRAQPEFGATLLAPPFNCEVFAFDPSPVSVAWYEQSPLRDNPRYHFFPYGAGGKDGEVELAEYSWGQVSIVKYPQFYRFDPVLGEHVTKNAQQERHIKLPVKTLSTILKELGHERIDVLKVDVEGSEFQFFEEIIDNNLCDSFDQLAIEWHHYDFDPRYGGGASPHLNMYYSIFAKKCGLEQFFCHDTMSGGWLASANEYSKSGLTMRYNLGSLMRKKHAKGE